MSVVKDLRTRMPWDVGKRLLASLDIPKGHGWDKTVERLEKNSDHVEVHSDELISSLKEHFVCGEKLSRFYEVPKDELAKVRRVLLSHKISASAFSKKYPALLSDAEIEKNYNQAKHTLIDVIKSEDGVAAVFASLRAIFVREQLDADDLPSELADKLAQYDEIVGVRLIKFQAMDIVWIPHDGTFVDVRVDFPRGMHHDQGLAALEATRAAFQTVVGTEPLGTPVNLFPLINLIYKEAKEGVVVEMAFGTTTASLKHEKMRRSGTDLRLEKYHQGGKAALKTPIEPYRLSVEYSLSFDGVTSLPELSLNGTSRMAGSPEPKLLDVTIRKCVGLADYEHVRSRIEHFILKHRATTKKK